MTSEREHHLASYAVTAADAGPRRHPEAEHPERDPFDLDRHRIVSCTAFRRLENKTQVFAPAFHDHFRTRLMHTLEAAHLARRLAIGLRGNDLLAEAITLAHDLGHPPFGHAGEAALNEALAGHGGFNHNVHALRVVDYLEHPYPPFRGLNLTRETRAGLIAHATRYDVAASPNEPDGDLPRRPSVEAQISSLADRMAYNCHDLEDAIGAQLLTLTELADVELWQTACAAISARYEVSHIFAIRRAVLDLLLDHLVADAVTASRPLLAKVNSLHDVRLAAGPTVRLSAAADRALVQLETLLMEKVYRHPDVVGTDTLGRDIIRALFNAYLNSPSELPRRFAARIDEQGAYRVVCDYIAGMTDRYGKAEYERLVRGGQTTL